MQLGAYTINNKIATIENTALNSFNPYPSSWHFCINTSAYGVTASTASQYSGPATIGNIKLGINQFPASGLNNTKYHYGMTYYPSVGSLQPIWPMTDWYAGIKSAAEMDPISGCMLSTQNTYMAGTYTLYIDYRASTRYILPEGDFRFCFGPLTTGNRYGSYYEAAEIFVVDTAKTIYTAWSGNPAATTGTAHPVCYFYSAYKSDTFTGKNAGKASAKEIVPLTANFNIQYPNEITGIGDINGTYPDIIIL